MAIRALLVYPEMPATYWSLRYALPFIGKRAVFPPLGLLTVAGLLPRDYEVALVDMNVSRLREEDVARADVVFTSSMLVQRESHERVVALCNRLGKTVVAGGPYPTSCHERIAGVDHFVLGEAECSLPSFLEDFGAGRARPLYASAERPDLRRTPPPRFGLIRSRDYASMALQFSRGCPHSCEFCDIIELFGRRVRTKDPDQFLAEVEALFSAGWRGSLFVVDDNFVGNLQAVKALLPKLAGWQQRRGYPFSLFTEATVSLGEDPELMDLMVRAGFNMVFLGIETPDRESLAALGKTTNLRADMLQSVRNIQRSGMEVSGGFILGFDGDRDDIFERQARFIQEAAIPTAMVGLLTALPKTRLYRRLEAEGRLREESGGNNTHDLRMNFVPKMDLQRLLAGYRQLLADLYDPGHYFDRCLGLLRNKPPRQASVRRVRKTELRAFFLSLLLQTFSSYSWDYWRFLVRGFCIRPGMLPETVTMAVKGHHFFKMTRRILAVETFKGRLEALALALQERAKGADPRDLSPQLAEMRAYRDAVVREMERRYRHLHRDFRSYARDALARFEAETDALLAQLSAQAATT